MNLTESNFAQWPVVGHDWAVHLFQQAIRFQRVHHAYLLTGPASIGKTTLARALAMALNCTNPYPPCGRCRSCMLITRNAHPDVSITEAEEVGGVLKIDQIRDLQRNLSLRPYEARCKVAILRRFHEANTATQNALLKTLEEPAHNVRLVLTADHSDLLLPTIVSRCQVFNLRPLALETTVVALGYLTSDDNRQHLTLVARLSGGRLGWAIRVYQDPAILEFRENAITTLEAILGAKNRTERFQYAERLAQDKTSLSVLLEYWLSYWRDVLLVTSQSTVPIVNIDREDSIHRLAQTLNFQQACAALNATQRVAGNLNRNANTRLCMEVLVLDYPSVS